MRIVLRVALVGSVLAVACAAPAARAPSRPLPAGPTRDLRALIAQIATQSPIPVLDALEQLEPTAPELIPLIDAPELEVRLAGLELLWKRGDPLPEGRPRQLVFWSMTWCAVDEAGGVVEWPADVLERDDRCRVRFSTLQPGVVRGAMDGLRSPCCEPLHQPGAGSPYFLVGRRVEKHCFTGTEPPPTMTALEEALELSQVADAETSRVQLWRRLADEGDLRDCRLVYEAGGNVCEPTPSWRIAIDLGGRWERIELGHWYAGDESEAGELDAAARGRIQAAVAALLAVPISAEAPRAEDGESGRNRVSLARTAGQWTAEPGEEPLFRAPHPFGGPSAPVAAVDALGQVLRRVLPPPRGGW